MHTAFSRFMKKAFLAGSGSALTMSINKSSSEVNDGNETGPTASSR